MNKPKKKLLLDKQTLRTLTADELDTAGGGTLMWGMIGIMASFVFAAAAFPQSR